MSDMFIGLNDLCSEQSSSFMNRIVYFSRLVSVNIRYICISGPSNKGNVSPQERIDHLRTTLRNFVTFVVYRPENNSYCLNCMSRPCSVTIGWTTGIRFSIGAGILIFAIASRSILGSTQAPIQWVPGLCPLGLKRHTKEQVQKKLY
jgi:hypothetical protein